MEEQENTKAKIGVSSCLLGEKVRYDGTNRYSDSVVATIKDYFEVIPICPEFEIGMGVPRETVRLEGDPMRPNMIGTESGTDWTDRMNLYSRRRLQDTNLQGVSGFILKSNSPSCGLRGVDVYGGRRKIGQSAGLFAADILRNFPTIPIEDEERLKEGKIRDSFITRVLAYHRRLKLR